jgi:transposase
VTREDRGALEESGVGRKEISLRFLETRPSFRVWENQIHRSFAEVQQRAFEKREAKCSRLGGLLHFFLQKINEKVKPNRTKE